MRDIAEAPGVEVKTLDHISCRKYFIFDLDGTLTNIDHRLPLLENKEDPDRWKRFYRACTEDKPNWPAIYCLWGAIATGIEVIILTGREASVKEQTLWWLRKHGVIGEGGHNPQLVMRKEGDYRPDVDLKETWLREFKKTGNIILGVFEDRESVVEMWKRNGIHCFHVTDDKVSL